MNRKKILVPLDGSPLSESVLTWLPGLAKGADEIEVLLVRAFEPPALLYLLPELSIPTTHALQDEHLGAATLEYLEGVADGLKGYQATPMVLIGEPASEILRVGQECDLILMASHGRGGLGRWLMGSVATKVARGATKPILVVSGRALDSEAGHRDIQRILVPLDGSEVAERAFRTACQWARRLGAKIRLYQAVPEVQLADPLAVESNKASLVFAQSYLQSLADSETGLEIDCVFRQTRGRTGIVAMADEWQADLILMGSHGKSGFQQWMLGSESERVLHEAHCPVMLVH